MTLLRSAGFLRETSGGHFLASLHSFVLRQLASDAAAQLATDSEEIGMPVPQGDLALLKTDIARELLESTIPARLAYVWTDGTPRVVPIWFHWTGDEIVFGSPSDAPKVKALRANAGVAVTIDTQGEPTRVLTLRGSASVELQEGVVPEYAQSARRYLGDEAGTEWVENLEQQGIGMARVVLRPTWVGLLDFEKRYPAALGGIIG